MWNFIMLLCLPHLPLLPCKLDFEFFNIASPSSDSTTYSNSTTTAAMSTFTSNSAMSTFTSNSPDHIFPTLTATIIKLNGDSYIL